MAKRTTAGKKAAIIPPKVKGAGKSVSYTGTFEPFAAGTDTPITVPTYRDHLLDLLNSRVAQDSRDLVRDLLRTDPDFSAALHAYLTVANTEFFAHVYDITGMPDRAGQIQLEQILSFLTVRYDYSTGYQPLKALSGFFEAMRYNILARGALSVEAVYDKTLSLYDIRMVPTNQVRWTEKTPGELKPFQLTADNKEISLDIPTFHYTSYRQDPSSAYPYSPFISAINTVAARHQVINDLYRIMAAVGFPRIHVKILEEVIRKNAPAQAQKDESKMREFINARRDEILSQVTTLRSDTAWVHFDSIEPGVMNEKGPGASLNVKEIIEVLNSLNQSALKTMATVIGRGSASGVNTATVEARIFTMNADELNVPIAELMSAILTFALRLQGSTSYVWCKFAKAEMRPEMELEPQRAVKQSRYLSLLSLGLITDDEFHLEMFNRFRPDSVKEMAGTGFENAKAQVDVSKISPNSDPLGRSISPDTPSANPQKDNKAGGVDA